MEFFFFLVGLAWLLRFANRLEASLEHDTPDEYVGFWLLETPAILGMCWVINKVFG